MKSDEDGGEARGAGARGLCVLCGLPAAGKSTLARALGQRLRRERGWAVGVVAYDDVLPDAFPGDADGRPLVSERGGASGGGASRGRSLQGRGLAAAGSGRSSQGCPLQPAELRKPHWATHSCYHLRSLKMFY